MQVIIEDGSSQVKYKTREMPKVCVCPSRVMLGSLIDNDTGQACARTWIVDGQYYTVAAVTVSPIPTANDEYQFGAVNRVLVQEVLRQLGFSGKEVTINVTLPVDRFFRSGWHEKHG